MILALILFLGAHPGKVPSYTTSALPVCDTTHDTWLVFDDTASKFKRCNGASWSIVDLGGGASLPTGTIIMLTSGTCATGYTEVAGLAGKTLVGTTAANGDVGTTGGSDNITPQGTVATGAFTGTAWTPPTISWPAGVPTFTGSAGTVPAHTISWPASVPTNGVIAIGTFVNVATTTSGNCAATNIAAGTGSTTACKATSPNLTVPAESHSGTLTSPTISWPASVPTMGTASFTPAGNNAWPAGVPTIGAYTPTGTIGTQAFSGTSFDNRSAYTKVIFCSKN